MREQLRVYERLGRINIQSCAPELFEKHEIKPKKYAIQERRFTDRNQIISRTNEVIRGRVVKSPRELTLPVSRACKSASSSTIAPLAVLTRMAPGFMIENSRDPKLEIVCGLRGKLRDTTSACSSRMSSEGTYVTYGPKSKGGDPMTS